MPWPAVILGIGLTVGIGALIWSERELRKVRQSLAEMQVLIDAGWFMDKDPDRG
jgi:hypothetical protein